MKPPTQLSRCFILPKEEADPPKGEGRRKKRTWRDIIPQELIDTLRPWAHPYLIFDVETKTDMLSGQQAKIGFWQDRGLLYGDRVGLFLRDILTPEKMDVARPEIWYGS